MSTYIVPNVDKPSSSCARASFECKFFLEGGIDTVMIYQLPRAKRQTGKTGQTGRTEKIELTFKHDFSGNLFRAAFAILGTFYKGASLSYDQAVR